MSESDTPTLENKVYRGGLVQYFIYLPYLLLFGWIATKLNIASAYAFMPAAVAALIFGYYSQGYFFKQPIIVYSSKGLWTRKLGWVPWKNVKNIEIERTTQFSTKGVGRTSSEIIIETIDGRTSSFDGDFISTNVQTLHSTLLKLKKKHSHENL